MNIGTIQRARASLVVLRGWDPNGARNRETVAPLGAGQTIMSGQLCKLVWNATLGREEFQIYATGDGANGIIPYFAKYDYNDTMIVGNGQFSALSCADSYELQTAYFDGQNAGGGQAALAGTQPTADQWLIPSTTTAGAVAAVTTPLSAGVVTLLGKCRPSIVGAANGSSVISNGPLNILPTTSNVAPDSTGQVLVLQVQTMFQLNAHA